MGENPIHPDFLELRTRAELLELCGDEEGAEQLRAQSLEIAREVDLTCYGYQLMWRNRYDDAIDLLQRNVAEHPDSWNAYHSLAEVFDEAGYTQSAIENYERALRRARDEADRQFIERRLASLTAFAEVC